MYLTNTDSIDKHPENTPSDFTVELSRPIFLDGDWECALREVRFLGDVGEKYIYVCADLCEDSFVCDTVYPVLRKVSRPFKKKTITSIYANPLYVAVKRDLLQSIRIFIRGERLKTTHFESGSLECTLHLTKRT